MNVYLDIETVPAQDATVREEIRAAVKAPATYKKPDSIAAWHAENGEAEADRKWRDTALDGTYGELLAIGLAIDDDPVRVFIRHLDEPERKVIHEAFAFLQELDEQEAWGTLGWVGHNVGWDLRFLFQRLVVNDLRPTVPLRLEAKPSSGYIVDTMTAWAGYGQRISLDRLCKALRIPSPKNDGENGAVVWDMVQAGRYAEVAAYCARDVEAVRQIHRRLDRVRY